MAAAVNTGMRWGELAALEWRDVDSERGLITVRKPKNNEMRHIPMNKSVQEALADHRRRQARDIGGLVPFVFANQQTRRPYVDVRKRLEESLAQAGITRHITFHSLRHTAASNMIMAGIDPETVGKILGHKDPKMTKRYTHLAPDYLKQSIEKLDYSAADRGQEDAKSHENQ